MLIPVIGLFRHALPGGSLQLAQGAAELVASYVEAIGTIGAVVVALFIQVYLVNKRRPALVVTLHEDLDEEDIVLLTGTTKTPNPSDSEGAPAIPFNRQECFWRVKIWAMPKRRTACSVRASLVRAHRPSGYEDPANKVPDSLFKWTGPSYEEAVDIAPGTWRRLDVLRYSQRGDDLQPILAPVLNRPGNASSWPPSERGRFDDSGTYVLDIAVSCDDAEPIFWRLTFSLTVPEDNPRVSEPQELHRRVAISSVERLPPASVTDMAAEDRIARVGDRRWSTHKRTS